MKTLLAACVVLVLQDADVKKWIAELANDDYDVREKATQNLLKLDAKSLPALQDALKASDDPEQRARLTCVIDRIDRGPLFKFSEEDPVTKWESAKNAGVEILEKGRGLRWWRLDGGADGSAVGVRLRIDGPAKDVRLSGELRITTQTLTGPGWWCDVHEGCYEHPVHLGLVDKLGRHVACRGFLRPFNETTKCKNYTVVEGDGWTAFDTGWIKLDEPAVWLDLGGKGWDFEASVRDLRINTR